jgi:mono/diheme cytochrome c family protein
MDPTRDNPLIRIKAFIDGLGIFTLFAVILLLILGVGALFGWFAKTDTPDDAAGDIRYEIKAEIDAAQATVLTEEQIAAVVGDVAGKLASSKPVAIEKPEQIVPGSDTANQLADAPAVDLTAIDTSAEDADAPIDPAVMEIGKTQFMVCGACHGQNGEGGAAGPPLAGSKLVSGPISNLILIQLRGLKRGPVEIDGVAYNFPAGMAPMSYQTDEQVAGVLTYVRNSFGNKASAVKPEQVEALRGEVGKPQVTAEELIQP